MGNTHTQSVNSKVLCEGFCVCGCALQPVSEAHAWSRLDRDLRTGCPIVVKFVRCVVSSRDPLL